MDAKEAAREIGWVPLEEFKGDPTKHISAEEFLERGQHLMPILQANNKKLFEKIEGKNGEIEALKGAVKSAADALEAFREYHSEAQKSAYAKAKRDLLEQKKDAIREGDAERVVDIDEQIGNLKPPKEIPKVQAPASDPALDPTFVGWKNENADWFGPDRKKTVYATTRAQYLRAMEPELVGRPFLDRVKADMLKEFGEESSAPSPSPRRETSKVEGGGGTTRTSNGKSYANLPPEAKAACDRFGSRLVGEGKAYKTVDEWRKKYAEDYDWS